jgi:hypothetical protein
MNVKRAHDNLIRRFVYTKAKHRLDWATIMHGTGLTQRTMWSFIQGRCVTTNTVYAIEAWLDAFEAQLKDEMTR